MAPYDTGAKPAIEKAIRDSDLGVNPTDDGKILRIVAARADRGAPQRVHQAGAHQGRGGTRRRTQHPPAPPSRRSTRPRRTATIGQDDDKGAEKRLDGLTKKHIDAIDDLLERKEAELLEV